MARVNHNDCHSSFSSCSYYIIIETVKIARPHEHPRVREMLETFHSLLGRAFFHSNKLSDPVRERDNPIQVFIPTLG